MRRDQIEFELPTESVCACCGDTTVHLVHFVSRNDCAFAVYFADFSAGHDFVSVLAGFGEWGDNSTPEQRIAFAMRIWTTGDRFQVGLINADESIYETKYLGRILDREEALTHPLKGEAFALTDHIVECDEPVIRFLEDVSVRQ